MLQNSIYLQGELKLHKHGGLEVEGREFVGEEATILCEKNQGNSLNVQEWRLKTESCCQINQGQNGE